MLAPNTRLRERYRILQKIGGGGFGYVYKAIDEVFGCSVAIKETKEEVADQDKLRRAFEREAKLLRNLKHDALPRVTDYFFQERTQFLVMDFIEGEDLASRLKHRLLEHQAPFAYNEILPWIDKTLDALEYLHSRPEPIIHRDIKPANIKIADDGGVYLLDFGLAKGVTGQMSTIVDGQPSSIVLGFTREYAPLEQLQDTANHAQSDVFALAATIYHLLTGQLPIAATQRDEALQRGQPDPLRPAHEINSKIPLAISLVISQGLIVRWWDRTASAAEMRAALIRACEVATTQPNPVFDPETQSDRMDVNQGLSTERNLPDQLEPELPSTKALKPTRRFHSWWLIAGAALILIAVVGVSLRFAFPDWWAPSVLIKSDATPNLSVKKALDDHTSDRKKHVWSVTFSQDGKLAASGSEDGTIVLYDTETWRPKFPALPGHTGEVFSVAFSPDGKMLASASGDGTIRRWNTQTGQLIMSPLTEGTNPVLRVAFSPDGNFLASCSGKIPSDGGDEITLWNVRNGWTPKKLDGPVKGVYAIAFSPDGEAFASAGRDGQLQMWLPRKNWVSSILSKYDHILTTLAFSNDSKYLACGSNDTTIKLWLNQPQTKLKWQELEESIGAQDSYITSVAFSPNSKTLVSATSDGKISLWDVTIRPPKLLRVSKAEKSQWSLALSPDGQTLLTGGEDNMVRVWQ
jgi:serine/threonine protein kinase